MATDLDSFRAWFRSTPNTKQILLYGIGSGLLCLPTNLISRIACTACCPYRGLLGGLPLLFLPFIAALIVAMLADWDGVSSHLAMRAGVDIGLRTGLVSAGTGFIVTVVTEIAGIMIAAANVQRTTNPWEAAMNAAALETLKQATAYTILFAAIFAVFGVGTAILGGSLGAAFKRSPGPKNSPEK